MSGETGPGDGARDGRGRLVTIWLLGLLSPAVPDGCVSCSQVPWQ